MLAPDDDSSRAFGYNAELWIDSQGAYPLVGRPAFYPWATDGSLTLQSGSLPVTKTQLLRQTAYPDLLRWQLNARVKGFSD
jgi:hypothetical protein